MLTALTLGAISVLLSHSRSLAVSDSQEMFFKQTVPHGQSGPLACVVYVCVHVFMYVNKCVSRCVSVRVFQHRTSPNSDV